MSISTDFREWKKNAILPPKIYVKYKQKLFFVPVFFFFLIFKEERLNKARKTNANSMKRFRVENVLKRF